MPIHPQLHDDTGASAPTAAVVRKQLEGILRARGFKASDRIRRLLDHLVAKTLDGQQRELTQRHLAEAVFGRGNDFDPERDSIVRVEMRKLRQALELYYSDTGSSDPLVIAIPNGTYRPRFTFQDGASPASDGGGEQIVSAATAAPLSIALLPLTDLSEDEGADWLAHGISEEVNAILSRIPELQITPPFAFLDTTDAREMMSRLRTGVHARFALEGSVRRVGGEIRVTVRLHDLVRDRQIWSERYDRDLQTAGLLDIQEDIARNVVGAAADMFTGAMGCSLRSELSPAAGGKLEVYEALLRFHHYLHVTTDAAYSLARNALETTFRSSPNIPLVMSMLADLRRAGHSLGFTDEADQLDSALSLLKDALSLAPDCLPCRVSLCFALLQKRDKVGILKQVDLILAEGTSPASYRADVGVPLALSGEWDRGCRLIEKQMAAAKVHPHYFQYPLFLRAFRAGDFERAAAVADDFQTTSFFFQPLLRAAVLGMLGRQNQAQHFIRELLGTRPHFPALGRRFLSSYVLEDNLVDDLIDGLRRAGLTVQ